MVKLKSPVVCDDMAHQSSTDSLQNESKMVTHRPVLLKDGKLNMNLPPLLNSLKRPMKPSYSEMTMNLKVPTSPIAFQSCCSNRDLLKPLISTPQVKLTEQCEIQSRLEIKSMKILRPLKHK